MNEDHICQAREQRAFHVSHRHRRHGKGGEVGDHWPSCAQDAGRMGWSLHIFKDSSQRQEGE